MTAHPIAMKCLVTAGPTFEPLDSVRRLTNFSTGKLGTLLANFLAERGHDVLLLLSETATWHGQIHAQRLERFTTTADLCRRIHEASGHGFDAVFHAAAVSDFGIGKIWERSASGEMRPVHSKKVTAAGSLFAELVPTPKIIAELRAWFPNACLIGWKYEVEGDRAAAISKAEKQLSVCRTDACVANGAAYGAGFGLVTGISECDHLENPPDLYEALERFALSTVQRH
jgi:phosphopantothenate---cysteine ligase (CTP)